MQSGIQQRLERIKHILPYVGLNASVLLDFRDEKRRLWASLEPGSFELKAGVPEIIGLW